MCWLGVCLCGCVHVCGQVSMQVCGGSQRPMPGVFFDCLSTSLFRQGFSLNLEFTSWLDWLAGELQGPHVPTPQCWGHRWTPLPLHECWRLGLAASCRCSRHLANLATSPAPLRSLSTEPCLPAEGCLHWRLQFSPLGILEVSHFYCSFCS